MHSESLSFLKIIFLLSFRFNFVKSRSNNLKITSLILRVEWNTLKVIKNIYLQVVQLTPIIISPFLLKIGDFIDFRT